MSGVYNSIDIFYNMAECLGLSRPKRGHHRREDSDNIQE